MSADGLDLRSGARPDLAATEGDSIHGSAASRSSLLRRYAVHPCVGAPGALGSIHNTEVQDDKCLTEEKQIVCTTGDCGEGKPHQSATDALYTSESGQLAGGEAPKITSREQLRCSEWRESSQERVEIRSAVAQTARAISAQEPGIFSGGLNQSFTFEKNSNYGHDGDYNSEAQVGDFCNAERALSRDLDTEGGKIIVTGIGVSETGKGQQNELTRQNILRKKLFSKEEGTADLGQDYSTSSADSPKENDNNYAAGTARWSEATSSALSKELTPLSTGGYNETSADGSQSVQVHALSQQYLSVPEEYKEVHSSHVSPSQSISTYDNRPPFRRSFSESTVEDYYRDERFELLARSDNNKAEVVSLKADNPTGVGASESVDAPTTGVVSSRRRKGVVTEPPKFETYPSITNADKTLYWNDTQSQAQPNNRARRRSSSQTSEEDEDCCASGMAQCELMHLRQKSRQRSISLSERSALSNVTNLKTRQQSSQYNASVFGVKKVHVARLATLQSFSDSTPISSLSSSRRSSVDTLKDSSVESVEDTSSNMDARSPPSITPSLSRSGSFKAKPNLPPFATFRRPTLSRKPASELSGEQLRAAQRSILSNDFLTKYSLRSRYGTSTRSFPTSPMMMSPGIKSPTYGDMNMSGSNKLQNLTQRLAMLNKENVSQDNYSETRSEPASIELHEQELDDNHHLRHSKTGSLDRDTIFDHYHLTSSPPQQMSTPKKNAKTSPALKVDDEDEVFTSDSAVEDGSESDNKSEQSSGYSDAIQTVTTASPTIVVLPKMRRRSGYDARNLPKIITSPVSEQEGSEQSGSRQRVRIDSSGRSGGNKASNGRFITHPPGRTEKMPESEERGPKDSNGFGTLHPEKGYGPQVCEGQLDDQMSVHSLADSHISQTDSEITSYSDVVESVIVGEGEIDRLDVSRRNRNSLKVKSKSDPSADKMKESVDIPNITKKSVQPQSASTPQLLEERDQITQLPEFQRSQEDTREKSKSENILPSTKPKIRAADTKEIELSSKGKFIIVKPDKIELEDNHHKRSSTSPETSFSDSQDRPRTLTIPGPGKGITRSKSAVGMIGSRKSKLSYSPSSASSLGIMKDPSPVRKTSVTMEEAFRSVHLSREAAAGAASCDLPSPSSSPTCQSTQDLTPTPRTSPARQTPIPFVQDKRYHIIKELYSVEQEYVDSLRILVDKYVIPLKAQDILDSSMVDEIFYKTMIPEILTHHAIFLTSLERTWENWSSTQTVGDVIKAMFSKQSVVESYLLFIKNYKRSEKMIDHALQTKSSFQKFSEQCQRSSRRKLKIKDLIIQPAQRIPRYELLIQRFLDHTSKDHPDYPLLKEAEKAIHDLAMKIGSVDKSRRGEDMQETLKKLELLLLIDDLATPDRVYLRHDMVTVPNRKDMCCIWMFSDLIVFTSVKRKSGSVGRKTSLLVQSPSGKVDFIENIKHKFWLKIGLDDVEIVNSPDTLTRKRHKDKDQLESDLAVLTDVTELVCKLNCEHQMLKDDIAELTNTLNNRLSELQLQSAGTDMCRIDLMATTPEGVSNIIAIFPSPDKRKSWEDGFMEAKQNLSAITEKRPPEFMQALQITKTRAGMQFSCASPVDGVNTSGYRDVWVCNSDGYVGHMCLLSLQPEPIVTLNTPVPGCNSKILCIFAVPAYNGPLKRKGSGRNRSMDSGHQDDFNQVSLELSNTESSDGSESDTESTDDEDDMPSYSRRNVGRHTRQSSESSKQTPLLDPYKSTMWLGTDNGYIHIFQSTDNIKTTKNKLKVPHPAGVLCIVHLDCKVFASLANGEIRVYRRDADGSWDTQHPDTLSVGTVTSPVTKMLAVAGKLWCGCQSGVMMLNPTTLVSEVSFQIPTDSPRPIQSMVCSGQGVWIAPQGSSKVVLFHATNRQFLTDISIAQAVTQKLMATDDIIRQHKTACLRITSLLACKDLLWVGTSAGVILTIPLPKITSSTTKSTLQAPSVTGLVHGHTGHVRFLTAVEMPSSRPFPEQSLQQHHLIRRRSIGGTPARATKMLVISGGDGYEDFRTGINNEAAGRDDSTNHLLLWQV